MSVQPPTRYENYRPEQGDAHEDTPADRVADPAPVVRQNAPLEFPTGGDPSTRRTVIGLLVAVPVVLLIGAGIFSDASTNQDAENSDGGPNPWDPVNQPTATVGDRYSVAVPEGWEYEADGGGGVEFTRGANRLTASAIEVPPSTLATEELAILAKGHRRGFSGKIARPVDDSTSDVQRASMAGRGRFQGEAATLLAELWIDASGSGLLITRILTAKPDAEISAQAQAMVDELSLEFP